MTYYRDLKTNENNIERIREVLRLPFFKMDKTQSHLLCGVVDGAIGDDIKAELERIGCSVCFSAYSNQTTMTMREARSVDWGFVCSKIVMGSYFMVMFFVFRYLMLYFK